MIRSPGAVSDAGPCGGFDRRIRPIRAACFFFLMTATHSTMAAPELSMQLSIVYYAISYCDKLGYVARVTNLQLYHRGSIVD